MQDLIRTLLGFKETEVAKEWQLHGLEVLRQLFNTKKTTAQKRELEFKFAGFRQLGVDVLVQKGQLVQALEVAELNKNLCLTWILDAHNEHIISPSWDDIQQLLNPETAVVYWHLSPTALTTFILKHNAPEPILIPTPNRHDLENWFSEWNKQYAEHRNDKQKQTQLSRGNPLMGTQAIPSWREQLHASMSQLAQYLNMSAILQEISCKSPVSPVTQLVLIPHRDLHRFPLHYLFEDENFTITYLPSAKIGLSLMEQARHLPLKPGGQDGQATRQDADDITVGAIHMPLLSVESPDSEDLEPLPYAEIESAAITQLFNNPTRLAQKQATRADVAAALLAGYSIFHFTGHATYNFRNPSQSALALSGNDRLALKDIAAMRLTGYLLASLSACETAITGNQSITAEYVGLASAFLSYGVAHVVSTLWTVESISSALIMIEFYRQLARGVAPALSLRRAQLWLRTVTNDKLAQWYEALATQLRNYAPSFSAYLETQAHILRNDTDTINLRPFADPYYWAGYTITGKINL